MRYFILGYVFLIALVVSVAGFRGTKSARSPIQVFRDMDMQAKSNAQSTSDFVASGQAAQELDEGSGTYRTLQESLLTDQASPIFPSRRRGQGGGFGAHGADASGWTRARGVRSIRCGVGASAEAGGGFNEALGSGQVPYGLAPPQGRPRREGSGGTASALVV